MINILMYDIPPVVVIAYLWFKEIIRRGGI
jgi:hypothetical protein